MIIDVRKNYPSVSCGFNRGRDFKVLCSFEPYTIVPENWDVDIIKKYDSFVTFNKKFCELNDIMSMSYITNGVCTGDVLGELDSFVSWEDKIKGICVIGRYGFAEWRKREGSIYHLREEFLNNLSVHPYLVKHLFCSRTSWGGRFYQGACEPADPWGMAPLKKVSEYLFYFCPENTYHSIWSWGFLTEKLQRAFKAKTVPIYIGCYNIEELVPKELFIDFRDFRNDYDLLAEYLINFPKEKYLAMTEKACEWDKTCKIRKVEDLNAILKLATGT